MSFTKILILGIIAGTAFTLFSSEAHAAFVPVDNFENLIPGPVHDQNGWYASDITSEVTFGLETPDNQVLAVPTNSTIVFHAAEILEGEERTLFLRFRYEEQLNVSFGMSESSFPDQFGNFEPELSLTSATNDLRINDGGTYSVLTTLEPGHWYNCWLHIDNDDDVTSVWLHDRTNDSATSADKLEIDGRDEFPFRQGTANDLQNFFIKTGGGDGVAGPLILDDIYLQDMEGVDLSYPGLAVAGVAILSSPLHLHGAQPNPFNPQTNISFTLDEPQSVQLVVYDLSGRRVIQLGEGLWEAGAHSVNWDGRDQAGSSVASGVYFVRLVGAQGVQSAKIALVR